MFCRQVALAFVLAFLSGCAVTRFLNEATVTLENTRPTLEKLPGLIEAAQIQITDLGETATRLFESTEQVVGLQSEGLTRIAASVETVLAELSATSHETTETLRVIREQANRVGDKTIWILASIAGGAGWLTKFSLVEKAKELKRKVVGSKQV